MQYKVVYEQAGYMFEAVEKLEKKVKNAYSRWLETIRWYINFK